MVYANYAAYLTSEKWQEVKRQFKDSPSYDEVCFLCYNKTHLQHHHWRYEKDWNNDTHLNLILLCYECHHQVHKTEMFHNSHNYRSEDLAKYLSHLIKELGLMELIYFGSLSNEF